MNTSADPSVQQAVQRLGIKISERRRRQRLSQSALAQKAGLSLSTVRRLERGESGVAIHALLMGFKALGLLGDFAIPMNSNPNVALKDDQCERLPKRVRQPKPKVVPVMVARQAPAEAMSQSPDFLCGSHVAEPQETNPPQKVTLAGELLAPKKMKLAAPKIQLNSPWAQNDLFSPS